MSLVDLDEKEIYMALDQLKPFEPGQREQKITLPFAGKLIQVAFHALRRPGEVIVYVGNCAEYIMFLTDFSHIKSEMMNAEECEYGLRGNQILALRDILAQYFHIRVTYLQDASKIRLCGPRGPQELQGLQGRKVSFAIYRLLTTGKTWYQDHGYLPRSEHFYPITQENYKEAKAHSLAIYAIMKKQINNLLDQTDLAIYHMPEAILERIEELKVLSPYEWEEYLQPLEDEKDGVEMLADFFYTRTRS